MRFPYLIMFVSFNSNTWMLLIGAGTAYTFPENLSSSSVFNIVFRIALSLFSLWNVLSIIDCLLSFFFCSLHCLSFICLRPLITLWRLQTLFTSRCFPLQHITTNKIRNSLMARCSRYNYVIKFVSDLRRVGDFLLIFRFLLPIQLTATISLKYC